MAEEYSQDLQQENLQTEKPVQVEVNSQEQTTQNLTDPPNKKLWQGLVDEGLYSGSFEDFQKKYSTSQEIEKLHKGLLEEDLYSKGIDDFYSQYFSDVKKKGGQNGIQISQIGGQDGVSQSPSPLSSQLKDGQQKTTKPAQVIIGETEGGIIQDDAITLLSEREQEKKNYSTAAGNENIIGINQAQSKLNDINFKLKALGVDDKTQKELDNELGDFPWGKNISKRKIEFNPAKYGLPEGEYTLSKILSITREKDYPAYINYLTQYKIGDLIDGKTGNKKGEVNDFLYTYKGGMTNIPSGTEGLDFLESNSNAVNKNIIKNLGVDNLGVLSDEAKKALAISDENFGLHVYYNFNDNDVKEFLQQKLNGADLNIKHKENAQEDAIKYGVNDNGEINYPAYESSQDLDNYDLNSIKSKLDLNNPVVAAAFNKYSSKVLLSDVLGKTTQLDENGQPITTYNNGHEWTQDDFENAAINYAATQEPLLAKQIKELNGEMPDNMRGELISSFLNNPSLKEEVKNSPELAKIYQQVKNGFRFKYKDANINRISTIISQGLEDMGETNWLVNVPTKDEVDNVVNRLKLEGKLSDTDIEDYNSSIRPTVGVGMSLFRGTVGTVLPGFVEPAKLKTGGIIENVQESFVGQIKKTAKGIEDVANIISPISVFPDEQKRLYNVLTDKYNTMMLNFKPVHEFSAASGNIVGFMIPLIGGGIALEAMGAGQAGEYINTILAFEGQNRDKAIEYFPGDTKNQIKYTVISTAGDATLGKLLPQKGFSQYFKNETKAVIEKLSNNAITEAQALVQLKNITNKATQLLGKNAKTAAVMEAFGLYHRLVDKAFGVGEAKDANTMEMVYDNVKNYKTTFLSTLLLSGIEVAGAGNKKVNNGILWEMANSPEKYEKLVNDLAQKDANIAGQKQDMLLNLSIASNIANDLNRPEIKISIEQKQKYLTLGVQKDILLRKATSISDVNISQKYVEQAEELNNKQKEILDDKDKADELKSYNVSEDANVEEVVPEVKVEKIEGIVPDEKLAQTQLVIDKVNKNEPVNENDLKEARDVLYTTLDENEGAAKFIEPLIQKLESHENITKTETVQTTERKPIEGTTAAKRKIEAKPALEQSTGSTATVTLADGTTKSGTLELENGNYVIKVEGEEPTVIGEKAMTDRDLKLPETEDPIELDDNGNVKSATFETKDGHKVTVTDPEKALDLGIQLHIDAVGEIPDEAFDRVYEDVVKEDKVEVPVEKPKKEKAEVPEQKKAEVDKEKKDREDTQSNLKKLSDDKFDETKKKAGYWARDIVDEQSIANDYHDALKISEPERTEKQNKIIEAVNDALGTKKRGEVKKGAKGKAAMFVAEHIEEPTTEGKETKKPSEEGEPVGAIPRQEHTVETIDQADTTGFNEVQKKNISDVKRVLKSITKLVGKDLGKKLKVVIHSTRESSAKAAYDSTIKGGGTEAEARENMQNQGNRGWWASADGEIHLNIPEVSSETTLHEGTHPILDIIAKVNPEAIDKFHKQLEVLPQGKEIIDLAKENYAEYDSQGNVTNSPTVKNEAITDYIAKVADGQIKIDKSNFEKVKDYVVNLLTKLGIMPEVDIRGINDLRKLAQTVSEKFAKGEEVKIGDDFNGVNDINANHGDIVISGKIPSNIKSVENKTDENKSAQFSKKKQDEFLKKEGAKLDRMGVEEDVKYGNLSDITGKNFTVTMSDRATVGKLSYKKGKAYLKQGGALYPLLMKKLGLDRVWASLEKSKLNTLLNNLKTDEEGYSYIGIMSMGKQSHMSNIDAFNFSFDVIENEIKNPDSKVTKEMLIDAVNQAYKKKYKTGIAISDRLGMPDINNNMSVSDIKKTVLEHISHDEAAFDIRRNFLESLLGGAEKKEGRLGSVPNYNKMAQILEEPLVRNASNGDVVAYMKVKKADLFVDKTNKDEVGHHNSYPYTIKSKSPIEYVFLNNPVHVSDIYPEFINKSGNKVSFEDAVAKYGLEKAKRTHARNVILSTPTEKIPTLPEQKTKQNDKENIPGISGKVGVGKEPVTAESIKGAGAEKTGAGGVLQAPGAEGESKKGIQLSKVKDVEATAKALQEVAISERDKQYDILKSQLADVKNPEELKGLQSRIKTIELEKQIDELNVKLDKASSSRVFDELNNQIDSIQKQYYKLNGKRYFEDTVSTGSSKSRIIAKANGDKQLIAKEYHDAIVIPESERTKDQNDLIAAVNKTLGVSELPKQEQEGVGEAKTEPPLFSKSKDKKISDMKDILKEYIDEGKSLDEIKDILKDEFGDYYKDVEGIIEQAHNEMTTTGIKNKVTERERAERGLEEIEVEAKRSFGKVFDDAKKMIANGEANGVTLAADIIKNPRPLKAEESAVLLIDRMRISKEYNKKNTELLDAQKNGETDKADIIQSQMEALEDEMDLNDEAARKSGYEQGLGLAARRMLIAQDYSLVTQMNRLKSANGGKEVPKQYQEQLKDLVSKLEEANKKLEDFERKQAGTKKQSDLAKVKPVSRTPEQVTKEKQSIKDKIISKWGQTLARMKSATSIKRSVSPTPITPEKQAQLESVVKDVNDMVKLYAEMGETNLKKIIDNIHQDLVGDLIDLNKSDIEDIVLGKYDIEKIKTPLTKEKIEAQANVRKVKTQIDLLKEELKLKQRGVSEKGMDYLHGWHRMSILSGIPGVAKIGTAALTRGVVTRSENVIGQVLGLIPGISRIASKAPRHGGMSAGAEAKAFTTWFDKMTREDVSQTFKTGLSDLDYEYGKKEPIAENVPHWMTFFGRMHAAMKLLPKRAEFFRSLEMRTQHALKNGADINDPVVQQEMAAGAYNDALRAVFMQDNPLTSAYSNMIKSMEKDYPAFANTAKFLFPIVKVPTNYISEASSYVPPIAAVKMLTSLYKGRKEMSPEQADYFMRALKKGAIGTAFIFMGFMNPQAVGGYYTGKRKKDELEAGELELFGVKLPHFMLHTPLLEMLQIGATMRRAQDAKLAKGQEPSKFDGIPTAFKGMAQQIPFFGTGERISTALERDKSDALNQYGYSLGQSLLEPQLMQNIADWTDRKDGETVKRKTETFGEKLKEGMPGLRSSLKEDISKYSKKEMKEFEGITDKGLNIPDLSKRTSYKIKIDESHPEGVMTEKEYDVFAVKVKEYEKEGYVLFNDRHGDDLNELKRLQSIKDISASDKADMNKLKNKLQEKIESIHDKAIKKAKRDVISE